MTNIKRRLESQVVTITDDEATSELIDVSEYAYGAVHVPTGSSITSLTLWGNCKVGDTMAELDTAVMAVAAGNVYQLPDVAFCCAEIRLQGDVAGTVTVSMKG